MADWRGWWRSDDYGGTFGPAGRGELPAPDLRTELLSTEALQRLQAWLYPESVDLTLEDRAMLAEMGIRWP